MCYQIGHDLIWNCGKSLTFYTIGHSGNQEHNESIEWRMRPKRKTCLWKLFINAKICVWKIDFPFQRIRQPLLSALLLHTKYIAFTYYQKVVQWAFLSLQFKSHFNDKRKFILTVGNKINLKLLLNHSLYTALFRLCVVCFALKHAAGAFQY